MGYGIIIKWLEIQQNNTRKTVRLFTWNLKEVEFDTRSKGVIKDSFETLPRTTLLPHAVQRFSICNSWSVLDRTPTLLPKNKMWSVWDRTPTLLPKNKINLRHSYSLFQIRSNTDFTALIKHKDSIRSPRPYTTISNRSDGWQSRIVKRSPTFVPE